MAAIIRWCAFTWQRVEQLPQLIKPLQVQAVLPCQVFVEVLVKRLERGRNDYPVDAKFRLLDCYLNTE